MKFLHLADLHIGKRVCEYSLLEDQRFILTRILEIVKVEKPDGVLIAGDVYDKSVPSAEAVQLLDDFLVKLSELAKVFLISGNHDSAERIAFGGRLMENCGVYMSPVYSGDVVPVTLQDEFGELDVWMLPFVRPADVRAVFESSSAECCFFGKNGADFDGGDAITDYTSAIRVAIGRMNFMPGRRNVLVAHQFVTGAERCDSEESVGGLDNVDASVFADFDYVALGHIHGPQNIRSVASDDACSVPRIRYSGTPLKYSLSEANHKKSVTVVEIFASGMALDAMAVATSNLARINVREIPLMPLRDVRKVRGDFAQVISAEFCASQTAAGKKLDDYVYMELTDENDIPDVAQKLRGVYPNLMSISYDNSRTRRQFSFLDAVDVEQKSPLTLFGEFFKEQNGRDMGAEQQEFISSLIKEIWEGGNETA